VGVFKADLSCNCWTPPSTTSVTVPFYSQEKKSHLHLQFHTPKPIDLSLEFLEQTACGEKVVINTEYPTNVVVSEKLSCVSSITRRCFPRVWARKRLGCTASVDVTVGGPMFTSIQLLRIRPTRAESFQPCQPECQWCGVIHKHVGQVQVSVTSNRVGLFPLISLIWVVALRCVDRYDEGACRE